MSRNLLYKKLYEQFGKSAQQFCEDSDGMFCEITEEYKNQETSDKLKGFSAKIYYNSYYVKFIYTAHSTLGLVNSTLGCSICLDKNGHSREIPLPLIADYCDYDIASPMFIANIMNESHMVEAFKIIGNAVIILIPEFSRSGIDEEYKNTILRAYTDEMKYIFDVDDLSKIIDYYFYDFFVLRFTTDVFQYLLKGNFEKVCKKLEKIKRPTGYEKRLLKMIRSGLYEKSQTDSAVISDIYKSGSQTKEDIKELLVLFASWLVLTPFASAVYLLVFFSVFAMENKDSVYLMGTLYNLPYCIMLGFFTAIALSYFTRFKFYKLLNKKGYEEYFRKSSLMNGKGADNFMKAFAYIIFCISIVMSVMFCKWNINFKENGFVDNSKFLSLQGEYYTYEEIDKVYYLSQRVNGFGDVLDFPSYVIVVDGKEIDLYDFADVDDYEEELLGFLEEKGVKIEN